MVSNCRAILVCCVMFGNKACTMPEFVKVLRCTILKALGRCCKWMILCACAGFFGLVFSCIFGAWSGFDLGCAVGHLAKFDRLGVGVFQSLVVLCGLPGSNIPILGSVVENLRNRRAVAWAGAFLVGMDVFDSSACSFLSGKLARRN